MKKRLLLADPKLVIYDPVTMLRVPADGIDADPRTPFWRRRLRDGSMLEDSPTRGPDSKPRHLMTSQED